MFRILAVIALLLISAPGWTAELLSENWNSYTADWSLTDDADGSDGYCPNDVFGFGPWAWCGSGVGSDSSHIEISTAARRGSSGRGYRLSIDPASVCVTVENYIGTNNVFALTYNFYIRWYFRANFNGQSSYKKLFRIDNNTSQRFIIDLYRTPSGTKFTLFTLADSFNGYGSPIPNWSLEANYTPNTWICVEAFVDQTNDQVTWWIDGVQQGSSVSFAASNYAIGGIRVGGNQCGNGNINGTPITGDAIVDYDDLIISTTYIGTSGGGGDTTPPAMSAGYPSANQNCTPHRNPITFGVTTDENATCKYSTLDVSYDSMSLTMDSTGGVTHTQSITPSCDFTHQYYVQCMDGSGNKSVTALPISFYVTPQYWRRGHNVEIK